MPYAQHTQKEEGVPPPHTHTDLYGHIFAFVRIWALSMFDAVEVVGPIHGERFCDYDREFGPVGRRIFGGI